MNEPRASVIVPARDAAATLGDCLRALAAQSVRRDDYEVIVVVDERSRDGTAAIARSSGATVLSVGHEAGTARYAGGVRNEGIRVARGRWVAFTDADCIPSRGWLRSLLSAVESRADQPPPLGAAGLTIGYESKTPAAHYVDLTGGLRAEHHLAHARYPWAPAGNVLYRREPLVAVGGFDARFESYEVADLHTRMRRQFGGEMIYVEHAVVHHRHRATWREYWEQQLSYGRGYAQFFHRYADELAWTPFSELRAWVALAPLAFAALIPGRGDAALRRRGTLVKRLGQRIGFTRTYWSRREAKRWRDRLDPSVDRVA